MNTFERFVPHGRARPRAVRFRFPRRQLRRQWLARLGVPGPRAGGDPFFSRTCLGNMGPCLRREPEKMLNVSEEWSYLLYHNPVCYPGQQWAKPGQDGFCLVRLGYRVVASGTTMSSKISTAFSKTSCPNSTNSPSPRPSPRRRGEGDQRAAPPALQPAGSG